MKQYLKKKNIVCVDVPVSSCADGEVLIRVENFLFTPQKIKRQLPTEKIPLAIKKLRQQGILSTASFLKAMLSQWKTLGAQCCGIVVESARLGFPKGTKVVGWTDAAFGTYATLKEPKKGSAKELLALSKKKNISTYTFADIPKMLKKKQPALVSISLESQSLQKTITFRSEKKPRGKVGVAIIGAGSIAREIHIPALLKNDNCYVKYIMTSKGHSAANAATYYDIPVATTSIQDILSDKEVDAVFILTPHKSHARYVIEATKNNKNVFVEKPLCIAKSELKNIKSAQKTIITTDFNKTFSRHSLKLEEFLTNRKNPVTLTFRIQTPRNESKTWLHDPKQGGKIIGSYCHLVDYALWAIPSTVRDVQVSNNAKAMVATFTFADGSLATLICSEDGTTQGKERIEAIVDNNVIVIDDWKSTYVNGKKVLSFFDKGHEKHINAFIAKSRKQLVSLSRAITSMEWTFKINALVKK